MSDAGKVDTRCYSVNPVPLYQKALMRWGKFQQLYKLAEESAELWGAIVRWRDKAYPQSEEDSVLEEIADVEIMIEQMRALFDWGNQREAKLERLARRLETP